MTGNLAGVIPTDERLANLILSRINPSTVIIYVNHRATPTRPVLARFAKNGSTLHHTHAASKYLIIIL